MRIVAGKNRCFRDAQEASLTVDMKTQAVAEGFAGAVFASGERPHDPPKHQVIRVALGTGHRHGRAYEPLHPPAHEHASE